MCSPSVLPYYVAGRLVGVCSRQLTEGLICVFTHFHSNGVDFCFWLTGISYLSFTNLVFPKGKSMGL